MQSLAYLGFKDPVFDAQRVFAAAMQALANPGQMQPLNGLDLDPPQPLAMGLAALALALADFETPIWLDGPLSASRQVAEFLRFNTSAPIISAPEAAAFALISDPAALSVPLAQFAQGTPEYPDRSTTLIIACDRLVRGEGWRLSGPGILGENFLQLQPMPGEFLVQWAENRGRFPCGVDILAVAGAELIGLPRSTRAGCEKVEAGFA